MKPVEREAKNRLLAITPPAPFCFTFHSLPLLLHLFPASVLPQCQFVLYHASLHFDNQDIVFYSYSSWAPQTAAKYPLFCLRNSAVQGQTHSSSEIVLKEVVSGVIFAVCVRVFMCVFDVCVASAAAGVAGEALGWRRDRQAHDQTVQIDRVFGFSWWGLGRQPGNCKCLRTCW